MAARVLPPEPDGEASLPRRMGPGGTHRANFCQNERPVGGPVNIGASPVSPNGRETSMSGMTPEDVYELAGADDPRVSPDGRTIAFSVWGVDKEANEYRGAVWLAPSDGSGPPQRFTSGEKRDATPRW